jgi:hypothetical protein
MSNGNSSYEIHDPDLHYSNCSYFEPLIGHAEAAEIGEIMSQYGLEPHEYDPVVDGLRRNPQAWLEFMMRYEQLLLPLYVVLLF